MTTTTPPPVTAGFPGMRVTQARAIGSEWTKFRSLRSTSITLAVAIALTVGIGALISAVTAARYGDMPPARKAHFNAIITSLNGVRISQLAVGVLGVLLITGEYATGMIRSSLTVIPKRLPILWAKMAVFAGTVGITSIASTIAAFYLGQALLAGKHLNASITDPGAARMVIGAGIYLLLIGLIGMGLGTLLRNTAGGISALVALFFVIPPILDLLPTGWSDTLGPYLPSTAGEAFWGNPDTAHLAPWAGLAVLCGWTALFVALAATRLKHDDA